MMLVPCRCGHSRVPVTTVSRMADCCEDRVMPPARISALQRYINANRHADLVVLHHPDTAVPDLVGVEFFATTVMAPGRAAIVDGSFLTALA